MTNMFKKSLVALALAGVSTGAMAADIATTSTTKVSNEYLNVNSTVASNSITVTLDDEYTENDFLILTFPGENSVDLNNLTTSINVASQTETTVVGFDDSSPACTNTTGTTGSTTDPANTDTTCTDDTSYNTKEFTVDYVLSDTDDMGNTYVKYRVTNLGTTGSSTVGADIDFGSVTVNSSALQGRDTYSVTYFARPNYENYNGSGVATETGVDPLDTSDSASLFAMADQWSITVGTKFDETIDVKSPADRKLFVGPVTTDRAVFTITENQIDLDGKGNVFAPAPFDKKVIYLDADVTISGNNMFGWLADDNATTTGFQYGTQVAFTPANCGSSLAHDSSELTFGCAAASLDTAQTLDFNLNGDEVVQNGSFSISAVVNYDDGASGELTSELASKDLGAWDINGSVTFIPYMPYSAQSESMQAGLAVDQIIYITNKAASTYSIEPSVSVRYILEDGTDGTLTNADLDGIKAGNGITKITGQVREALFQKGLLGSSKKIALEVTVEEDPALIEVYSAYNVGGSDRGWVQNDSQRVYGHSGS